MGTTPFRPARPALAQNERPRTPRFVPQADVTVLDPLTTSASVTRNRVLQEFDQRFGRDGDLQDAVRNLSVFWNVRRLS
ncbi:hypothetical protein MKK88_16960 [Methylobacterium sp. E-005]|uniref:hypothetical protein n=1 Tax=Methylobacterium sp. E-005 TaxID=2836549 RepID=UPI001FB99635|nr:hypothetical protein [Methylobacterium sp. E-005]MCJ2087660.1 hypothetical protein [Methylobacterium sp. E-005]